jgi:hypothetical protein
MANTNNFSCSLLKIERLRQNKGQKEVCYGICVPSYLSKIEHNQVAPDQAILKQLFHRLDIEFYCEEEFLRKNNQLIEQFYEQLFYCLSTSSYEELLKDDQKLSYSPLALDWLIIRYGFHNEEAGKLLSECQINMSDKQLACYYLAKPLLFGQADQVIPYYQKAYYILNNSFSLLTLMEAYYMAGQYDKIHEHIDKCISLALEEGNTYNLAACNQLMGSVYACLNTEELMMPYYRRAIHLLQNTGWKDKLNLIYYNIGATYISCKKYDMALYYLDMVQEEDTFLLNHKKALTLIRSGKTQEADRFICMMEQAIAAKELKTTEVSIEKMMLEEVRYECRNNHLEDEGFIVLLENLMDILKKERHKGYVLFYKDVLKEAYCRQRKYKKALELTTYIS